MSRDKKVNLDRIVFIGRTFEEYMNMFSLTFDELRGKTILDCPSGACSFTAIASTFKLDVTACDIAYDHHTSDLHSKGLQDLQHAMAHVEKEQSKYVWDYFRNIEALKKDRLKALNEYSSDRMNHPNRYIAAALPQLPFRDGEFDLILSAHFLFMYRDRLDLDFHLAAIKELLRVSREELRIFPLVDLDGNRYPYLDEIKSFLTQSGCTFEERKSTYEFQRHANSMLRIIHNP